MLDETLRRRDVNKGDVGVVGTDDGGAIFDALLPSNKALMLDGTSGISCLIVIGFEFTDISWSDSICQNK